MGFAFLSAASSCARPSLFSASGTDLSALSAAICAQLASEKIDASIQGQALSDYPPLQCRCRSRARASLRNRHQGPFHHGIRDEVEQSFGRPCRQCDCRFKRSYELTSSIVPRGTSFHRPVELESPSIGLYPV